MAAPCLPQSADPPARLPRPRTPVVGRSVDLAIAEQLLRRDAVALLTLAGAGGSGKTRLALELAERLRADFADAVAVVALAEIGDPELVLPAVAGALGVLLRPGDSPVDLVAAALAGVYRRAPNFQTTSAQGRLRSAWWVSARR